MRNGAARRKQLLYAHRGASAERPENSLPAFERALELGADGLELDVHMTSDGHVVVAHDDDGTRLAGIPRAIRQCTLAEIQRWDLGRGFVDHDGERPFAGSECRVPTLAEVLHGLPAVPLNIDLKQERPPICAAVIDLVHDARAAERVTLASFRTTTLREVRERGYRGPTGLSQGEVALLYGLPNAVLKRRRPRGQAAQLPTSFGPIRLGTAQMIRKCHSLDLRVDFWTINDPTEAARLLALGADGIMTDDPGRIAPTFAAATSTN